MGSISPVVNDPSDTMFVYLTGRAVGGVFVMVGEAMGGGVGRIGVVAGDVIEGARRVGGRGEVDSNTWCEWLGRTVEEVGLILEHGNAGDGESEYLQGGKEDTVDKEEETAEKEEITLIQK